MHQRLRDSGAFFVAMFPLRLPPMKRSVTAPAEAARSAAGITILRDPATIVCMALVLALVAVAVRIANVW
jgi:hypothetical protein